MSEFNSQEIITNYHYSLGQEAALAMNSLLTMTGQNYHQVKAGEGISPEVQSAFHMFEETASQHLGRSESNDTLMQTQAGTPLITLSNQDTPKPLEIATEPLLDSFLSDEQLETRTQNEEKFDKTVHELLEPIVHAFLDKVPAQPQKRRLWQRAQSSMSPAELTVKANNLYHSLTILAATDGSRLASVRNSIKQYPFFTDSEAAFQISLDAFGADYPECLEVTWRNRHDNQLARQAFESYGQTLAELLEATGHNDGNNRLYRYMKRDSFGRVGAGSDPQTQNSLAMSFNSRSFTIHSSNPTHADDNARRTYNFDAVHNVFKGHDGKNRQLPDISIEQYFAVMNSVLQIFPLTELRSL